MPKSKLFDDDSEEEVTLKTENEYAKKYDSWREKEELHKLEQKYGSKALNSDGLESTDSEDESDESLEVSEEVEKQFLKTLSLLKTKDARIYDPKINFFNEKIEKEKETKPEPKKLTFVDSDDDDDDDGNIFSIEKKAVIEPSETSSKNVAKEDKIKEYLTGNVEHVDDEVEKDLAPLRALWSDPKLDDGEAFLRDYILNKRYLDEDDGGAAGDKIRDDEELEEDEKRVEEQGQFERAYNFRFEEPDEEYLKRFPRTMNYIRPKDDRRSRKRAELRARKEEEKKKKMEEIARLKALKLKEIQEKIAKIKEVTGNQELAFKEEDIEGDFDPEEHDRRMKALFDEQYYGDADDEKPVFPDLDEELEIENWEKFENEKDCNQEYEDDEPHCEDDDFNMDADYDPKKAKEKLLEELTRNMGKKRRNRKKKSKLAQLLSEDKPKFVPDFEKTYSEFMEEYYKMDCEDIVGGDLPTRFKYRQVVPNDYGLTVEEILLADDKELTQWVPLKKLLKYRPENVEKGEVKVYRHKAADVSLKKKILPSLFKELSEEPEIVVPIEENKKKKKKKKKKNKNITEKVLSTENEELENVTEPPAIDVEINIAGDENKSTKTKKRKNKNQGNTADESNISSTNDDVIVCNKETTPVETEINVAQDKSNKKKKRKNKIKENCMEQLVQNPIERSHIAITTISDTENKSNRDIKVNHKIVESENSRNERSETKLADENIHKKTKNRKNKQEFTIENADDVMPSKINGHNSDNKVNKIKKLKRKLDNTTETQVPSKKKKKNKHFNKQTKYQTKSNTQNDKSNPLSMLSDERLKAYGLNPKKYRSFLKYKKF